MNGDFRELYLLSRDELLWSGDARPSILDSDGDQPRRDDQAVQGLRKRMCYELTLATSALYWTARYLAYARLVHLHLSGGRSNLDEADQEGLDRLIAEVDTDGRDRSALSGLARREEQARYARHLAGDFVVPEAAPEDACPEPK